MINMNQSIQLNHWSQTQFLEGHRSAQFSSNPHQTHLIWLIKVSRITRNFQAGVIWSETVQICGPPEIEFETTEWNKDPFTHAGACLMFWGPSASIPGGAPSVDFAIDSGVGIGIVYILSILIWYLSIQLSILLSIIWWKNVLCKKMMNISSYFITAVYKCIQANRKGT